MEKLTQLFTIIKYQEKVLNLLVYQYFRLVLFSEKVQIIILKYFQKYVNILLKKKKIPKYIIDDIEMYSDFHRENSDEKNSDE